MDTEQGFFKMPEKMDDAALIVRVKEVGLLFVVGEVLTIKNSRFRVRSFGKTLMTLQLLLHETKEEKKI